jgi:hypothetical protein
VDVGAGAVLTVSVGFAVNPPSSAELAYVAAGVTIGQPDLSWIGSRPS